MKKNSSINLQDVWVRARKTFIQAFIPALPATGELTTTGLIAAGAAAASAVWNAVLYPLVVLPLQERFAGFWTRVQNPD